MKKVTILALHLGYGGIERCISNLANVLIKDYEVEIISTYKIYDKPSFYIDDKVKIKYLIEDLKPNQRELKAAIKKFKIITSIKEFKKALKILKLKKNLMIEAIKNCNSDVIISTRDIHNLWLSKYGNKKALRIGWEHNHHNNNQKFIKKIVNSVKELDYFVLVSKELTLFYQEQLKDTNCKVVHIPNMLDYYPKKVSDLKEKRIISVGRLNPEKGYLDLIDVFKMVHDVYPDWSLDIMGSGVLKEQIEKKIKEYNLDDKIKLHGFQPREYINEYLEKSSIYVLPSKTESFAIVLLEAFAFGIPAVAFTSAQGANEIIKDNWDGYLIKDRDKQKMAKRICELISNYNRRFIMGQNAFKKSKNYSQEKIKKQWIMLIENGR